MPIIKSKSAPGNLYKYIEDKQVFSECISFGNFSKLHLLGQQDILTFGDYNRKKTATKNKRQKIISYFYRNLLHSKL